MIYVFMEVYHTSQNYLDLEKLTYPLKNKIDILKE